MGLMFTVFGLMDSYFIPQPPPRIPWQFQFLVAAAHRTSRVLFPLQVPWWLLLLFGFSVPLALTLLAAELYNILAFT